MLSRYSICNNKKSTFLSEGSIWKIVRNRQNRYTIQSNCATCGSKKSRFIKEQKALRILSNLGIKTPLSQVPLLNILF